MLEDPRSLYEHVAGFGVVSKVSNYHKRHGTVAVPHLQSDVQIYKAVHRIAPWHAVAAEADMSTAVSVTTLRCASAERFTRPPMRRRYVELFSLTIIEIHFVACLIFNQTTQIG